MRTVVAAFLVAVLAFGVAAVVAEDPTRAEVESYIVQPGDSFYRIADKLAPSASRSTAAEYLQRANGYPSPIYPGQVLWFSPSDPALAATTTTSTTSTTVAPTTTTSTSTTVPPTTTTTSTTSTTTTTTTVPSTTVPPATTVPSGVQFLETFDGNQGLDRFHAGVYHRGPDGRPPYTADSGGSWHGDHDLGDEHNDCGDPTLTHRDLEFRVGDNQATRRANSFYVCRNHWMSSLGDVDGYSIAWFTPDGDKDGKADVFTGARTVSWDVTVTDLGSRRWWEVSIVPVGAEFLASSDWIADIANIARYTSDSVIVGNGPAGGDVNITTQRVWRAPDRRTCSMPGIGGMDSAGCASKALRRPFSITDNGNNTLTVSYGGMFVQTVPGRFPSSFQVYFKDHAYTPDKDPGVGLTSHWDNITVRS